MTFFTFLAAAALVAASAGSNEDSHQQVLSAEGAALRGSVGAARAGGPYKIAVFSQNMGGVYPRAASRETAAALFAQRGIVCHDADVIFVGTQETGDRVAGANVWTFIFEACGLSGGHRAEDLAAWSAQYTRHQETIMAPGFSQFGMVYVHKDSLLAGPTFKTRKKGLAGAFGLLGNKGAIIASLARADGTHRITFVTAHLGMDGKAEANWDFGYNTRLGNWNAVTEELGAWAQSLVIATGDTNMRLDGVKGDQLRHAFANAPIFNGYTEPSFPSYFTCRFDERAEDLSTANSEYAQCRNGRGEFAFDAAEIAAQNPSNAQSPNSWMPNEAHYMKYVAPSEGKAPAWVKVPDNLAALPEKAKSQMGFNVEIDALTQKMLKRTHNCASLHKFRPLSFCDRVFYKQTPGVQVTYDKYDSVPIMAESDHNAIAAIINVNFQ